MSVEEQNIHLSADDMRLNSCVESMLIYGIKQPTIIKNNEDGYSFTFEVPSDVNREMAIVIMEDYVKAIANLVNKGLKPENHLIVKKRNANS